jgi:hypothetical protein
LQVVIISISLSALFLTPIPVRADDAAAIYQKAIAEVRTFSPSGSDLESPAYPPFGSAWDELAEKSWHENSRVFPLVRKARSANDAKWPTGTQYLNSTRNLANIIGDAALYQHLQGNEPEAIELVRDLDHLSRMLEKDATEAELYRLLVGTGIDALNMYRVTLIASDIRLTGDPANKKAILTKDVAKLVKELIESESTESKLHRALGRKYDERINAPALAEDMSLERIIEQTNRRYADRVMAGMSLACHVFRHESGRWPASLEELATKSPHVQVDPWGDGKQTFGYALIKGGLKDGSDRPLVYSRCESQNGLLYRIDEPQYSFYSSDGTGRPYREVKHGGQFRDVTLWQGSRAGPNSETMKPLE